MSTVEMSLRSSELPGAMAEMRIWLDERRFEPTIFCCREAGPGFEVRVEFKVTAEAQAFADRFSGHIGSPPAANEARQSVRDFASVLPPQGVVG